MGQNQPGLENKLAGPAPTWSREEKEYHRWARIRLAQQTKLAGGIICPPPSCMQNNIRSACRRENGHRKQKQRGGGGCTWRGGGGVAGRTTSLVVLWWRPVAVSWLTNGDSKQRHCCFKRRRERFFLFPSLAFSSLFFCFFSGFPFILPVCFQVPYPVSSFSFLSIWVYQWFSFSVRSLSSVRFLFLSVSSLFFFLLCFRFLSAFSFFCPLLSLLSVPCFLSSSLCWRWASIYRAKGVGLIIVAHGAGQRWSVGQWAPLARRVAPGFSSSRLGVSRLLQGTRLAGINEERGRKLSSFPCCMSGGRRKKNSVAQNDTVLPLFFF